MRRFAIVVVSGLLTLSTAAWIATTAIGQTIGTADKTKTLLRKSGM